MSILRCKMCGGTLDLISDSTVTECGYCGTKQTVPTIYDEKKINLFSRANRLRAACEFDKSASVYESIISDFPEEAEAYWGLVLCKYGIEYVDDPATGKKIPTCHRSSFDSLMDDPDFEMVMETSESEARRVYREEAKAIEEIRKSIVEVSSQEEPYDIFICYKESDDIGNRTIDSVLAQDIYEMLTKNDYRVFFSRISLEDKLGVEYEPYIFAALNSARIMLAIGTDYEYYNAVWVKNEWSRFLKLMASDKSKVLIPCYKDIDAYDIPKEFKRFQAQNLGKIGALQDLLRGIKKILPKGEEKASDRSTVAVSSTGNNAHLVIPLLERAFIFLEESNWKAADDYFERVLDLDPKNPHAYAGKLMAQAKCTTENELIKLSVDYSSFPIYNSFCRFGEETLREKISRRTEEIREQQRLQEEAKQRESKYQKALGILKERKSLSLLEEAYHLLMEIGDYKDSRDLSKQCDPVEIRRIIAKKAYDEAVDLMNSTSPRLLEMAIEKLKEAGDFADAPELLASCQRRLEKLREEEEIAARVKRKVMLEVEIVQLQRKSETMTIFDSTDSERKRIKYKIRQLKEELEAVTRLVEKDEEMRKTKGSL